MSPLLDWLREQVSGWQPSIVGVFREDGDHSWPISANNAAELRKTLTATGHLLPLPTEPAALANVMEIGLRQHFSSAIRALTDARINEGTERSYPDLEFFGERFGEGFRAVDIKCARRKIRKDGTATNLNNRIALYTGNTYFLWPQLKFSGILRPFGEYRESLSVVVIYTFEKDLPERISDVEVVVHETWKIGSKSRASATREYIGSVNSIQQIREGVGEFNTQEEFYKYWRSSARKWKKSPEAERLLRQAIDNR